MLQQIRLENFKGLKKAQIDFSRITVLIGPNGTGKSSISHALMVLRQSIGRGDLIVNGPLMNLGDFSDVLNKEASNGQVGIGVTIGVADYQGLGIPEDASFSYDAYFSPQVIGFDATISSPTEKHLVAKWKSGQAGSVEPRSLVPQDLPSGKVAVDLQVGSDIARPFSIGGGSHGPGLKDEYEAFAEKIKELISSIAIELDRVYYVPAIRGLERSDYELVEQPTIDFRPGENARLASTFAYAERDIEEIVSTWAQSITGSNLASKLIPGRKVGIESYAVPEGIPLIGDGFGTNQLVQLLLTLAITPAKSLLDIEEPEIHLHPKAQAKLCDILAEVAKSQDKELVISTHSQHVLYAFVSAVKNGVLTRDELSIYYFREKGEEPRRVEQDEYGDIYDWGENFFAWQ